MVLLNFKKLRIHFLSLQSQTVGAKVYMSRRKQPRLINKDFKSYLIYKNMKILRQLNYRLGSSQLLKKA